jgi:hypothetical protein
MGFPMGAPPSIRAIYRRLKDEGKPDKVARIADAEAPAIVNGKEELRSNSQAARARAAIYRKRRTLQISAENG